MHRDRLQRLASLSIVGLLLYGCAHDWDAYHPGTDGATGSAGAGGATCGAGLSSCPGGCVDTDFDPANCGACDNACPTGQACLDGACVAACGVGLTNCGGQCIDTASDPQHCGGCAVACATGAICDASQCACADPEIYCGPVSGCVDTLSDALNCGACSVACGTNEACVDGGCVCNPLTCGICNIQDIGSTAPQATSGSTTGARDDVDINCVPPGAGEVVYEFTAPSDGAYTLDTFGSGYDTALAVLDMGCVELECNDDTIDVASRVSVTLSQGQAIYIVVDGWDGDEGDFDLHLEQAGCPAADLGSAVPQTVSGTTVGLPDLIAPSCGDPGSPEATYSFTAPADGTYSFDTFGSNFDTVLHIHDGDCSGPELGCDDDTGGGQSQVTLTLAAGQTVVIVVDGFGGDADDYDLHIN